MEQDVPFVVVEILSWERMILKHFIQKCCVNGTIQRINYLLKVIRQILDEKFGGNLSGIAIRYKLIGMENVTGIKEAKFKKGLLRRIELITQILNIKLNDEYLFTEIETVFTRAIPVNENEIITVAKSLYGIVSKKTLFSMLPFIEDPQTEIEALEQEAENTLDYKNLGAENE